MIDYATTNKRTGQIMLHAQGMTLEDILLNVSEDSLLHINSLPPDFDHYWDGDGRWLPIGKRPSLNHTWSWDEHAWLDLRVLEELRAAKWEEIKAARDAAEAGGFAYLGRWIDSDARSVQRIAGAVQAAQKAVKLGQPFAIEWTCADNSVLQLDADGMTAMPAALAMHANALHEQARALRAVIGDAQTPAEVAAIAWPSATLQLQLVAT